MNVIKHNGSSEPLDISKIEKSVSWATDNISNVSASDILIKSKLHFYDGIETDYLLDVTIKTAYDMSTIRHPNYDLVAKNLKLQKLYKNLFKSVTPYTINDFIKDKHHLYNERVYRAYKKYGKELEKIINHSRDFTFSASGFDFVIENYGKIKNKIPLESPQFIYMLIAMDAFVDESLDDIRDLYEGLSTYKITLPSPEMNAFRSLDPSNKIEPNTNFASCCLIRIGDSIDSWNEGTKAIVSHTCASAGTGIDIADISSIGDLVKNKSIIHGGKVPEIHSINKDINKSQQNNRRGSGTPFVSFFDPEIETILSIKSPRTEAAKRINELSYGIKINQLFEDRVKNNGVISLFSIRDVPNLLDAFYDKDISKFYTVYEQAERNELYKSQINARELLQIIAKEMIETSAYYIANIDLINQNTPYKNPISQLNICMEDAVPTLPLDSKKPNDPAIGICVLGNINQSAVSIEELPKYTNLLIKLQTLSVLRQTQPTTQAQAFVNTYRDIGIGLSNHAHWLARNNWKYGDEKALYEWDRYLEHFQYGLISASVDLVSKVGSIDTSLIDIDKIIPENRWHTNIIDRKPELDWKALKQRIINEGIANAGLSMIPPSESSSVPSNQVSSLEPLKNLLTIKDKNGKNLKQFAPDVTKLIMNYDIAYERKINNNYLKHMSILFKWIDKSASVNGFFNPELYPDGKIPIKEVYDFILRSRRLGIKSIYYINTKVENDDILEQGCSGGGCEC